MFKVLNPHLNIRKRPRHLHNHDSSQSPSAEKKSPNVDLKPPSKDMSPPQESKKPVELSTLHQPTIDQLIQELAQSVSRNEEYAKMIVSLQQENKH